MSFRLRPAVASDAETAGRICYDAFATINREHGFPPDFASPQLAIGVLSFLISHPGFYVVVAERDGKVIGSNALDERSLIPGIGPIVGSSRVDLQACKLEYSIVSPK